MLRRMPADATPDTVFDPALEMPSLGPEWDEALRMGVDTAMLLENAQKTPAERIQSLVAHNRFVWRVHQQTQPPELPADGK